MTTETADWSAMTYDEQRAFLGLPDVRRAVEWDRMARVVKAFGSALDRFAERLDAAFTPDPRAGDYGRAG